MTTKKRRRSPARPKVGTVDGAPMNPDLKAAFQAEGLLPQDPPAEDNRPVRVVLDQNVPGGFRMERV